MKNIHIVGAGGPAGIGLSRCLRDHYELSGSEDSKWAKLMMEIPDTYSRDISLHIPVPDSMVLLHSKTEYGDKFLPDQKQIELCQEKAKTAEVLGDLAPTTYWVRDTNGAGGKGAQIASEVLPGRNFSQEFVFYNGEKVAEFQKERISYSVKEKTTGLDNRGSSMVSICTNKPNIRKRAEQALNKVALATDTLLHGFYGVDFVEDVNGVAKVTEINAGRLLTASYSFFHLTGYNLPLIGVKAFFGEELPLLPEYPEGWGIIRQVDQLPRLFPPDVTKEWV